MEGERSAEKNGISNEKKMKKEKVKRAAAVRETPERISPSSAPPPM